MKTHQLWKTILLYATVVLIAVWTLAPYVWLIISSISNKVDLLDVPLRWLPSQPTLAHYKELFFGGGATGEHVALFLLTLKNSCLVTFLSTIVCMVIGVLAAYALARMVFPGHRYYLLILMATQMVPPIAIVIPGYVILERLRLRDTYLGLVLVYITFILPLVVWIMRGYFSSIPSDLEDSAMIDGCTRLGALFRIVLPLSGPGLVSTSVFAFIAAWNEFFYAFIYTEYRAKTLPVLIGEFSSKFGPDYIKLATAGVVASIPPVILALLFQRFLIRGLTAGAVKG
ncbi:MAG: carbohydrate ABC transporter permease [Anaerolineae bacterium]